MSALDAAAGALDDGGVVVCPTETVYGLMGRADRPEAIERIFEVKGRPRERVLQVLLADADRIADLAVVDERASRLVEAFLPGPLTLVLPASEQAPAAVTRNGTIGIRVPDHPAPRELAGRCGPLAATSANRTGEPTPSELGAIRTLFGDAVDAYVDGGTVEGAGSTVVDLSGERPEVLREGALDASAIMMILA